MDNIVFEKFNDYEARKKHLEKLNKDSIDLIDLQKDIDSFVYKQKNKIDNIEYYIEKSKKIINETNIVLNKADDNKKSIDKRYIWGSILFVPFIYLLLL